MKIVGPLMMEHRVIERMLRLLTSELSYIKREDKMHIDFMRSAVYFLKIYADKCHHGKEEDVLFRELKKKEIADEYRATMLKLIEEHKKGREYVASLEENISRFTANDLSALANIKLALQNILELYPPHIDTEDKHFFLSILQYFSEEENQALLNEMREFDKGIDKKKYVDPLKSLEGKIEGSL